VICQLKLYSGTAWTFRARDRDRLVALKKARKGPITQWQATEELGQNERHIRQLLKSLHFTNNRAMTIVVRTILESCQDSLRPSY